MARPFGRRATIGEPAAAEQGRPPLRVLRAAGQRIDLTAKTSGAAITATRQAWQREAWSYRRMIGELRFAQRLLARQVARVRFYVAEDRPWPADPIALDSDDCELDAQLIADAITNFERLPIDANPEGFIARLTNNLQVTGEAWVHIDAQDRFHVRSTSEVSATREGKVVISTMPGTTTSAGAGGRPVDPEQEELLRCWVPDDEYSDLADSPMQSLLDVAEDVVLAGRETRAASRSRVAANGILLLPDSLEMAQTREDEAGDDVTADTFMADLTEAMLASIKDDGAAEAVVPIVIRGDKEDIAAVKHLTLQREDSGSVLAKQSTAILRLLKGIDIQPEQVEGLGSTNHWNAWVIDARAVRDQVEPYAETAAACLLQAFLRPALLALGHAAEQVDRVVIAVDPSPLAENPNRGQDARDAWDRGAISNDTLRSALGFDEEDAPDDDETVRRLAQRGLLPVSVIAQMYGLRPDPRAAPVTVDGEVTDSAARPVARPGEVQAESPVPATQPQPGATPAAVTAAATELDVEDLLRVDEDLARRLADIDTALTDRILTAADATLARIVEKAGARVRSAAQKDRALAARVVGMDAAAIPAALGRDQVQAFVPVDDLLAGGWDQLHTQFVRWVAAAGTEAARAYADAASLDRGEHRAMTARADTRLAPLVEPAWHHLLEALRDAGEAALFPRDDDTPVRGESTDGLFTPADVVEALAVAGGESLAGPGEGSFAARPGRRTRLRPGASFTAGPVLARLAAEAGAVFLGWEWQYRAEILRDTYPDHRDLDGERFLSWSDPVLSTAASSSWLGAHYRPQDHRGCRCVAARVLAWPTDPDGILGLRLREAAGDPRHLRPDPEPAAPEGRPRLRDRVVAAVEALVAKHITRRKRR